jgi:hypothetical protein
MVPSTAVDSSVGRLRAIDGADLPADYPDIGFFEVDRKVFPDQYETLSAQELGSSRLSLEWYRRNPHIYTVLLSGDTVVGYCNAMPLREDAFHAMLEGKLADGKIEAEMIETLERPGRYRLFCCGVAILEQYRHRGVALRTLLSALYRTWSASADRGCVISEIAGVAWSEDGRAMCEGFGLQLLRRHEAFGDVYHTTVADAVENGRRTPVRRLGELYLSRGLMARS